MDLMLRGKTAVVTASSKGLGRAVAEQLAAEGADLLLCSRSEEAIRKTADDIHKRYGVRVESLAVDVGKAGDIARLVETAAARFETVDALVCNAGGPPSGSFLSFDDEAWEKAFFGNMMSVVRLIRGFHPLLARQGGRIVTVASTSVKTPIPGLVLSNTLRTGVVGLMKTLSIEFAPDGILLNTVCPGRIMTDRIVELDSIRAERDQVPLEAVQEKLRQDIPLGRYGEPEELATIAAYLLSPRNSYMTGSVFYVDGGAVKSL
ncbi:SDR family oxidoreductase [Paenibacillus doosanensis]|uniref:3-oxoacyl-[acyl-carrier-protein] reductase FabG n=1 Tax=Paenibacillus konkukensis TaxID=2020716 RepID=A0ABY4RY23_9BACL|nr:MULTISPECIES: SDR family oxidoreductase [Paenibacillus]MCS7459428.1 SDR family oxidoreductase [Paenibacillus doosanensis]UQZ87222.1 3-oxoacyl-[acyl-carrier-protein] reductase FabG [Paenibacillus konkukensis]